MNRVFSELRCKYLLPIYKKWKSLGFLPSMGLAIYRQTPKLCPQTLVFESGILMGFEFDHQRINLTTQSDLNFVKVSYGGPFEKILELLCWVHTLIYIRVDSRFAPSQWEMPLLCNDISHWLGASLESALYIIEFVIIMLNITWWYSRPCYTSAQLIGLWEMWPLSWIRNIQTHIKDRYFENFL